MDLSHNLVGMTLRWNRIFFSSGLKHIDHSRDKCEHRVRVAVPLWWASNATFLALKLPLLMWQQHPWKGCSSFWTFCFLDKGSHLSKQKQNAGTRCCFESGDLFNAPCMKWLNWCNTASMVDEWVVTKTTGCSGCWNGSTCIWQSFVIAECQCEWRDVLFQVFQLTSRHASKAFCCWSIFEWTCAAWQLKQSAVLQHSHCLWCWKERKKETKEKSRGPLDDGSVFFQWGLKVRAQDRCIQFCCLPLQWGLVCVSAQPIQTVSLNASVQARFSKRVNSKVKQRLELKMWKLIVCWQSSKTCWFSVCSCTWRGWSVNVIHFVIMFENNDWNCQCVIVRLLWIFSFRNAILWRLCFLEAIKIDIWDAECCHDCHSKCSEINDEWKWREWIQRCAFMLSRWCVATRALFCKHDWKWDEFKSCFEGWSIFSINEERRQPQRRPQL